MRDLIAVFREAEARAARERGGFALFALCEREDAPGQWDVVASAPWLGIDRAAIADLIDLLGEDMSLPDWLRINRVVPLSVTDPLVQTITAAYTAEHQTLELPLRKFGGVSVTRTVLMTADKRLAGVAEAVAA